MDAFLPIEDIHPGMKSWSAVVAVQEKRQATASATSPTKYQKLVLVDAKGSRVEAILFNRAVELMGTRLSLFKKYKISNAEVRPIDLKYQTDGLTVQWVISTKTVVEELGDGTDMMPTKFSYTMFKDLPQFMELNHQTVDILAVVICALPTVSFTNEYGPGKAQKMVIINEEKIPLQLSLFNEFIDNEGRQIVDNMSNFPVILCRRVKVKSYNGVALSTRKDSVVLIDPPFNETQRLKDWAAENAILFSQIIRDRSYTQYNPDLFAQSPQKFTLIFYLQPTQKIAWVRASISFENILQRYWYMACAKCCKATDASYGYSYSCNKCSTYQEAIPRCRFDVTLSDRSGSITATLFGEQAERLLTYTALDAMQYFNKNVELPLQHVHQQLQTKEFAVQIQSASSRYGDLEQRYTILCYYEEVLGQSSTQPFSENYDSPVNKPPEQNVCIHPTGNENASPLVRINLASKFDEASSAEETAKEGNDTPSPSSNAKKAKIA